ncbi:hypothetical protein C474_16899 [Halogeometricum pallidum JCM 14848]|uniref:Uncharacterized protein n=1 Tax=Halogeometricum pallidum JCM 14848 TaxID=1227487 RepID=M0CWQ0_HALPD|nr:hypothetical protein [Halogeometricum pallidum]ELZ27048.1 hypothetical protein C474_16899 [Halogeometricum pallidum JCM 14848]
MNDTEQTTYFAGIDGQSDAALPEWYDARAQPDEVVSFAEAVRDLPRAVEADIAYADPYSGEWVETERFNALVEPTRLAEQEEGVDPLFHVPTQSYSIINPTHVYAPLEEVIRETELDGQSLGDAVFGEIRQYRGGGEVHMDIMFDGLSVTLPDRSEPITMGVSSGYDFFGGHAVYVEGFARDNACANSIRSLTNREVVKHVGNVPDFGTWWAELLGQLELVANDLYGFILDASDISVNFRQVPFDLAEFYELLGFPSYLAGHAASDARANATNVFDIDMWTLHSGATHALTHFFTGKEGTSLDGYVRIANDMLFNPSRTIEVVRDTYEQQAVEAASEDGQTGLGSQLALAQVELVEEDVREKATTFEDREEMLRERFETDH